MQNKTARVYISVAAAAVLWFVIFVIKPVNFWLSMCVGILLLFACAVCSDRALFPGEKFRWRDIAVGVVSAAVLYVIFFIGNYLSALILPFKDAQIGSVYMNRAGTSPFLIGAALFLVIGPGEEIFWRGFVQKTLAGKYGAKAVVLSALLYTAVHVVTLNFMLIMASLVCGLFWGFLYYREKRLLPVILSHALWDLTVFLILPFK